MCTTRRVIQHMDAFRFALAQPTRYSISSHHRLGPGESNSPGSRNKCEGAHEGRGRFSDAGEVTRPRGRIPPVHVFFYSEFARKPFVRDAERCERGAERGERGKGDRRRGGGSARDTHDLVTLPPRPRPRAPCGPRRFAPPSPMIDAPAQTPSDFSNLRLHPFPAYPPAHQPHDER
jgi:hypothetical protein